MQKRKKTLPKKQAVRKTKTGSTIKKDVSGKKFKNLTPSSKSHLPYSFQRQLFKDFTLYQFTAESSVVYSVVFAKDLDFDTRIKYPFLSENLRQLILIIGDSDKHTADPRIGISVSMILGRYDSKNENTLVLYYVCDDTDELGLYRSRLFSIWHSVLPSPVKWLHESFQVSNKNSGKTIYAGLLWKASHPNASFVKEEFLKLLQSI